MNKLKKIDKGGRPTKRTDETVTKLESIFKIGGTIEEASSYAGINPKTYHDWIKSDEGFVTKMTAAKHYADIAAKNVVIDDIIKNKDVGSAKWWLEKRQFKDSKAVGVRTDGETIEVVVMDYEG